MEAGGRSNGRMYDGVGGPRTAQRLKAHTDFQRHTVTPTAATSTPYTLTLHIRTPLSHTHHHSTLLSPSCLASSMLQR